MGRGNLHKVIVGLLLVPALLLALAACGEAEPTATPTPTATPSDNEPGVTPQPTGQTGWDDLVARAQAEGEIVVQMGSSNLRLQRAVVEEFGERFGIRPVISGGSSSRGTQRLLAEYGNDVHAVDFTFFGPEETAILANAGVYQPLEPLLIAEDVVDTSLWFGNRIHWVNEERNAAYTAVAAQSLFNEITYNTENVPQQEVDAVDSSWDLVDPKWNEYSIAGGSPVSGGGGGSSTWAKALYHPDLGPEFIQGFLSMDITWHDNSRPLVDGFLRGTYNIALTSGGSISELQVVASEQGFPIASYFIPLEQNDVRPEFQPENPIGVAREPVNPAAAQLLANWYMSKEGQQAYHAGRGLEVPDRPSLRTDVELGAIDERFAIRPGVTYLDLSSLAPMYFEEAVAYSEGLWRHHARGAPMPEEPGWFGELPFEDIPTIEGPSR